MNRSPFSPKKLLVNALVIAAAAGLGLLVGFVLRARSGSPAPESPVAVATPVGESGAKAFPAANALATVPLADDSPLATRLAHDLSMSKGVTRWLYWLDALEQAAPSDFPRLFALAESNPATRRLVADRWIELYPRQLFDAVIAAMKGSGRSSLRGLANQLLREWSRKDLDAAIAAMNESRDVGIVSSWRDTVAAAVIEKDPERGLRLFYEWHIEHFGPRMTAIGPWAAADPRHAAQFVLDHPSGYASQLTMETVAKEWASTDPRAALEFGARKWDELNAMLASTALKEWAGKNLNEAAEWLGKTDDGTRNRLSPAFVEAWAKQDAAGALAWCQANLAGSDLADAVGGVMKGAAAKDVAVAASLVDSMSPSPARSAAAVAVAEKWFPEFSSDQAAKPEAIAWLNNLDADTIKRVLEEQRLQWASADPRSMAAFIAARSTDQIPASAYSYVARELARVSPTEAMQWASQLPASQSLRVGSEAFAAWNVTQPESATKWLTSLPPSDPRREPYFQESIRTLAWDSQAAERLAALTPSERIQARATIEAMTSLPQDRRDKLLAALR